MSPPAKSARRRSREFALQGLYSRLIAGQEASDIAAQLRQTKGFERADGAYFSALLNGAIEQQHDIEAALAPCLDRRVEELSPVERGILLLGAWELKNVPDVPYKVVINEAVELAKSYGGTEGHKFVNGVLDKLARSLRTPAADSV
jgi:N utilization substance protein B